MSLRERALKAHEEALEEWCRQEAEAAERFYQDTAQHSTAALTELLRNLLRIDPESVQILKGTNGEGIAVFVTEGLAFTADKDALLLTATREGVPYPKRHSWTRIASLYELGAYLTKMGSPKRDPTGRAEAV